MNKQQVKGAANEVAGNIKKNVGKAMDDHTMQAKGAARELKGKVQQKVGDVKEDVKEDMKDRQAANDVKDAHHRDLDR